MAKDKQKGLISAVGYIRMSTDDQKDSPERQRGEIVAMAERDGYQILRWYEDHGLTGTTSKNRPNFLKMMVDVGKADFKAVLMYEQSRFSREDVFDCVAHWKQLKDAGVILVTVQRGEMDFDNLGGLITAMIGQHEARSESVKIAQRSVSGKRMKAALGQHMSTIPFGFDREVYDEAGNFVKRVSSFERFKRPKSWKCKLVPSADPEIIDAVRYAFEEIQRGGSFNGIATEFNRRKLTTSRGNPWTQITVRRMLKNPVYVGLLRYGQNQTGKFEKTGDVIMVPNAHSAIVSADQFEQVNAILATCHRTPGDVGAPGRYLLSHLIRCAHCGRKMSGKKCGSGRRYQCFVRKPGIKECPQYPSVRAISLEELVLRLIVKHVLNEENRETFFENLKRRINRTELPSGEHGQLMELRLKIERAQENLALAEDPEAFRAISALISKWKDQETKIHDRIDQASSKRYAEELRPFASPEMLAYLRENLHVAERHLLAVSIATVIQRITITDSKNGVIEFSTDVYDGGPIAFNDEDLRPDRSYLRAVEYVKSTGGNRVASEELAKGMGISRKVAVVQADKAVREGLLEMERKGMAKIYYSKST